MNVHLGTGQHRPLMRSRWAAIGAAIAVTLGAGGIFAASAASSAPSSVVMIDPVRILDTRDPVNVGLPGPFVSNVPQKLQASGPIPTTSGVQTPVPVGATGVLLNVTVVDPSTNGFLSVRPGDQGGVPVTSSLNFEAEDVAPNAVQVGLPTEGVNAGQIDLTFDAYGVGGSTTDLLIDVVGYFLPSSAGPRGFSAWDVIPSGVTVTGQYEWSGWYDGGGVFGFLLSVDLPGVAPVPLTDGTVNFGNVNGFVDADATCTGAPSLPTAPPGKVCIYVVTSSRVEVFFAQGRAAALPTRGFAVSFQEYARLGAGTVRLSITWAYTAP